MCIRDSEYGGNREAQQLSVAEMVGQLDAHEKTSKEKVGRPAGAAVRAARRRRGTRAAQGGRACKGAGPYALRRARGEAAAYAVRAGLYVVKPGARNAPQRRMPSARRAHMPAVKLHIAPQQPQKLGALGLSLIHI